METIEKMSMIEMFLKEMDAEAETTRKMLSRVPDDKYDWQPHKKSMTIQRLATHIADIPSWPGMVMNTAELDFAAHTHKEPVITNTSQLLEYYEKCYTEGRAGLANAKEEQLDDLWTLRNGDYIISVRPKRDVIRMSFCQIVHHRAQLGVFLRLLDVPIPGSYGPSADDDNF
jgi:uncharacterized damage-inducible protein DinB